MTCNPKFGKLNKPRVQSATSWFSKWLNILLCAVTLECAQRWRKWGITKIQFGSRNTLYHLLSSLKEIGHFLQKQKRELWITDIDCSLTMGVCLQPFCDWALGKEDLSSSEDALYSIFGLFQFVELNFGLSSFCEENWGKGPFRFLFWYDEQIFSLVKHFLHFSFKSHSQSNYLTSTKLCTSFHELLHVVFLIRAISRICTLGSAVNTN